MLLQRSRSEPCHCCTAMVPLQPCVLPVHERIQKAFCVHLSSEINEHMNNSATESARSAPINAKFRQQPGFLPTTNTSHNRSLIAFRKLSKPEFGTQMPMYKLAKAPPNTYREYHERRKNGHHHKLKSGKISVFPTNNSLPLTKIHRLPTAFLTHTQHNERAHAQSPSAVTGGRRGCQHPNVREIVLSELAKQELLRSDERDINECCLLASFGDVRARPA